jgi:gluconate kinase
MTYQSLNPSTGKLAKKFEELTDKELDIKIATRHEHFMPRSLLQSQFEALEEPGTDENPIIVSIEPQPREIVAQILTALNLADCSQPPRKQL